MDTLDDPGNSDAAQDLYGLGVRIGMYLQTFGLFLPILRLRATGTKLTSSGFVLAILASWADLVRREQVSPAEAITILMIANTLSLPAFAACLVPGTTLGEGLGFLLTFVSNVWLNGAVLMFWSTGYRTLPLLGTANKTWFFVQVDIDGWYRILSLVLSIFACLFLLSAFPLAGSVIKACVKDWIGKAPDSSQNELSQARGAMARVTTLFYILIAVFLIATIEMTIRFNALKPSTNLTQPGQSIPLAIGVITLVDGFLTLISLRKREREMEKHEEL